MAASPLALSPQRQESAMRTLKRLPTVICPGCHVRMAAGAAEGGPLAPEQSRGLAALAFS